MMYPPLHIPTSTKLARNLVELHPHYHLLIYPNHANRIYLTLFSLIKGVFHIAEMSLRLGTDHSLKEFFIPDLQSTIQLDSIHVRQVDEQWTYPNHQHQRCEINYVVEGTQLMRINELEYRQEQGDIILLRPGDIHSSASGSPNGFTYF